MSALSDTGLEQYATPGGAAALHAKIAANMAGAVTAGDPTGPAWLVEEARWALFKAADGRVTGRADVNVSAVHLVLGYVLHLEQRLETQAQRGAA